jgi:alanine-glyoxylate transaminase/serine-glyoxylate transaminase/serine-pyruvate transaminase
VAISDRALEYIRNRPKPPTSWYLDLSLIADYWGPDHIAHHTAPVSMIYGLREAVGMALNETLEVRWKRHEANAAALRAGLVALGLELPISKDERLDQLTIVKLPKGIDDVKLRTQLLSEYSIEVGRGLGKFAGEVIRIGLMGESCVPANVFALLNALEKILPEHGYEVAKGVASAAASAQLAENPSPVYTS